MEKNVLTNFSIAMEESYSKMPWSATNAGFFTSDYCEFPGQAGCDGFSQEKAPPENRRGLSFSGAEAYLEAFSTISTEIRQISSSSSVGMTATFTRLSSVEM